MSVEISMGSLNKFGSPWENACVIQYGRRWVDVRGLEGFPRIGWDVGVEHII